MVEGKVPSVDVRQSAGCSLRHLGETLCISRLNMASSKLDLATGGQRTEEEGKERTKRKRPREEDKREKAREPTAEMAGL